MGVITERRSYVAGRWVEGDEVLRGREPGRRDPGRRAVGDPRRRVPRGPIDEARRAFDEGPWPSMTRRRAGRRSCTRSLDHLEANADDARPDDGRRGRSAHDVRRGACSWAAAWCSPATPSTSTCRCRTRTTTRCPSTSWSPVGSRSSVRRHEPVGVVTAITPYNAAILMAFQKLIPALMAGNSVILRPSPLTPISSLDVRRRRRRRRPPARRAQRGRRGRAPPAPRCSPPTPRSTWSRSPARRPSASRSSPRPRRR